VNILDHHISRTINIFFGGKEKIFKLAQISIQFLLQRYVPQIMGDSGSDQIDLKVLQQNFVIE
jgi:hypothetical protein